MSGESAMERGVEIDDCSNSNSNSNKDDIDDAKSTNGKIAEKENNNATQQREKRWNLQDFEIGKVFKILFCFEIFIYFLSNFLTFFCNGHFFFFFFVKATWTWTVWRSVFGTIKTKQIHCCTQGLMNNKRIKEEKKNFFFCDFFFFFFFFLNFVP
jgi:hypothetical protein